MYRRTPSSNLYSTNGLIHQSDGGVYMYMYLYLGDKYMCMYYYVEHFEIENTVQNPVNVYTMSTYLHSRTLLDFKKNSHIIHTLAVFCYSLRHDGSCASSRTYRIQECMEKWTPTTQNAWSENPWILGVST